MANQTVSLPALLVPTQVLAVAALGETPPSTEADPPPSSPAAPSPLTLPPEAGAVDVVNAHIAAELESQFGVPFDEGLARAAEQDEQFLELYRIDAALGSSLSGGYYVDHANGGVGVLTVTDEALAAATLAELDISLTSADLVIQQVEESKAELEAIRDSSMVALAAAGVPVEDAFISAESNSVITEVAASSPVDVEAVVAELLLPDEVVGVEGVVSQELTSCHPSEVYCDRLRGGEAIRNESSFSPGACTAGLPVRSRTDSKPYIVTAGHCVEDLGPYWLSAFASASNQGRWGSDHSSAYSSQGVDVGLISIVDASIVESRVHVESSSQSSGGVTRNTSRDTDYPIYQTGKWTETIGEGGWICRTGYWSGTDCGQMVGSTGAGTARVNLKSCQGDSGAPMFANNRIYGFLSNGIGTDVTFSTRDPAGDMWKEETALCLENTEYEGATRAFDTLNVRLP